MVLVSLLVRLWVEIKIVNIIHSIRAVSLLVRLWVEIAGNGSTGSSRRCQPPCEAVSWNVMSVFVRLCAFTSASLWGCELKYPESKKAVFAGCQPPCEAVSWNVHHVLVHGLSDAVSLLVRLWVEMPSILPFGDAMSVSLLVRLWVEISTYGATGASAIRQPPCEAVSWNVIAGIVGPEDVKSASLWGCELKYSEPQHYQQQRQVSLLVRLWVEMLCGVSWLPSHQRSASLWGCELKWNNQLWSLSETGQPPCEAVSWNDQGFINAVTRRTSASLWGCELKSLLLKCCFLSRCCQPPCEAVSWNNNIINNFLPPTCVSLLVRLWVEIDWDSRKSPHIAVSLLVRLWVEIDPVSFQDLGTTSASLWGCELKCQYLGVSTPDARQPPCEAVSWNVRLLEHIPAS